MDKYGSEQIIPVFDEEFRVIIFNCTKAYSSECLNTKRVLNKVKSDIASLTLLFSFT